MTATTPEQVKVLPRPLIRTFWMLHRGIVRLTGGRFGIQRPKRGARFGMLRLHTLGRRSGQARIAMIGYFEDGPNLVTLAMNGWGTADPAWWLNLQANPVATVDVPGGSRTVQARAASGEERDRLWASFRDYPGWGSDLGALSARRPVETAIVVFEPRPDGDGHAERPGLPDLGHEDAVDRIPTASRIVPTASHARLRLRLRHLWIVPALMIMLYANGQAQHLGVGILPLLVFGIAPDLPRLLALVRTDVRGRLAPLSVPAFDLLHHPLPPVALLALAATGVVPPIFYVGALAWIGHILFGLAIGDRPRRRDGSFHPLWRGGRRSPSAETPA